MPFVQVGMIALRSPDGAFLPGTPIYKDVPTNERGRTLREEEALTDITKLFAQKFKAYKDGCREAGVSTVELDG